MWLTWYIYDSVRSTTQLRRKIKRRGKKIGRMIDYASYASYALLYACSRNISTFVRELSIIPSARNYLRHPIDNYRSLFTCSLRCTESAVTAFGSALVSLMRWMRLLELISGDYDTEMMNRYLRFPFLRFALFCNNMINVYFYS